MHVEPGLESSGLGSDERRPSSARARASSVVDGTTCCAHNGGRLMRLSKPRKVTLPKLHRAPRNLQPLQGPMETKDRGWKPWSPGPSQPLVMVSKHTHPPQRISGGSWMPAQKSASTMLSCLHPSMTSCVATTWLNGEASGIGQIRNFTHSLVAQPFS